VGVGVGWGHEPQMSAATVLHCRFAVSLSSYPRWSSSFSSPARRMLSRRHRRLLCAQSGHSVQGRIARGAE
jgi:hypothetical protein